MTDISRRSFLHFLGASKTMLAISTATLTHTTAASMSNRPGGKTVKVKLRASTSQHLLGDESVETWTYNGMLPGPLIRANVGDIIQVDVVNDLPNPTTIHWHGVEVPAGQDGSSISQSPIPPGGRYQYEFRAITPSLYWYHPHFEANEQVERGLYGALLIDDPDENMMLGIRPPHEHILILDDVLIKNRQIAPPFPSNPLENAVTHFNGRFGNVLLVNGEKLPSINVRNGVAQRLRMVNVSNSRFMRVSFAAGQRVWRIGGDAGLLETPLTISPINLIHGGHGEHGMISDPDLGLGVMLTPGERADLIWVPMGDNQEVVSLSWHDWPRGNHSAQYGPDGSIIIAHDHTDGMAPPENLIDFRLLGDPSPKALSYAPPSHVRTIEALVPSGPSIPVMMGHGPADAKGDVTFFMQMDTSGSKPFPALTPSDVATVSPGNVRMIEVTNMTMGAHNFHIHGFFFQHIETQFYDMDTDANNYKAEASYRENKDTILVPGRLGAAMRSNTVVRLAVAFDDTGREGQIEAWGKTPLGDRSGGWLMHCHLLEHAESGMMTFVQVRAE